MARTRKMPKPYYDRKRNLWVAEVPLGNGKRKRVARRELAECEKELVAVLHDLDQNLPVSDGRMTVRAWCEQYVADILPYGKARKSEKSHARVLRDYVYDAKIGKRPLAKLEPADVRKWMRELEQTDCKHKRGGQVVKLAPGTVAKARAVLSAAIQAAYMDEKVPRNVVHLTVPPEHHTVPALKAMKPAEVDAVLASSAQGLPCYRNGTKELTGDYRRDRFYALAVLVLAVGMREAECLDLLWENVDLVAGTIDITKAKTKAGVRLIPIPRFAVDALQAHRSAQVQERLAADVWHNPSLVFPTTIGSRLSARNCLRWWHALTERSGIGRRSFHSTRHTAGTIMRQRGVPLELIAEILGHSRIEVTRRFYAEADVELLRTASNAMEGAYTMPTANSDGM